MYTMIKSNKIIRTIGLATVSLLLLGSCDMDRYPLTSFSEETFYNDEANVKLALNGLYRGGITLGVDYNVSDWWAYSATILFDGISDIGYDRRGFNNAIGQLTPEQLRKPIYGLPIFIKNLISG